MKQTFVLMISIIATFLVLAVSGASFAQTTTQNQNQNQTQTSPSPTVVPSRAPSTGHGSM